MDWNWSIIIIIAIVSIIGKLIAKANKSNTTVGGYPRPSQPPRPAEPLPPWLTGQKTIMPPVPIEDGEGVSLEEAGPWTGEGEGPSGSLGKMDIEEGPPDTPILETLANSSR